ncbi:MAG: L-aspartate oxidase [Bacteroidetes bacterium]|nr:MAG: L-aspartate oxidase [Bacteroidota bacterium]
MKYKVDFLILGSGIAGLSYALKVAEHGKVLIITKAKANESSTKYAQGGIAGVMYSPDSYEKHIQDTLIAGAGLCNEEIVRMTITESTERIKELIAWGTSFDKESDGLYRLGKEGGHSENRILHHKDKTGKEIERALLKKVKKHPNIELWENQFAIDLITQHHLGHIINRGQADIECYGAYTLDPKTKTIKTILAKTTLIATGGAGNVYRNTTNPPVATGDGIAMVYRAKGMVENMEFIQFHPTALYNPGEKPSFLISEALRGFGAILKNHKGESFMEKYDKRGSLAPRDIVARSIDKEMKKSGQSHVYLDATFLDPNDLIESFPGIYAKCLSLNIDIRKEMIPVVPAAHYTCGGIKVNKNGQTTINHLYASGESSSTGLHGANRLASNSLLEALVFSHHAAIDAIEKVKKAHFNEQIPDWDAEGKKLNEEMVLITQTRQELQNIMSSYVSIVRSNLRLQRALDRLGLIYRETEELYNKSVLDEQLCELRNSINVSYLIVKMAMQRKESIGLHYSIDYKPRKKRT